MEKITNETINRWFVAYAEMPLPMGMYDISIDFKKVHELGRQVVEKWANDDKSDPDELELMIESAIKDAFERNPKEYAKIDAKTLGVANVTSWIESTPLAERNEFMSNAAKLYPSGRPWADYANTHLFNPKDEMYDFCIWQAEHWEDFEMKEPTKEPTANNNNIQTPVEEQGTKAMGQNKTTQNNAPVTQSAATPTASNELAQYFTRYVDMTLSDGTTPYKGEDVDAVYYKTEDGKYAICELSLADYELYEHTEEPRNGFVRMKYALNGPTHKMECSEWVNGFRFDWSGAKALQALHEIDNPSIEEMCNAMTKPCAARFRKLQAGENTEPKKSEPKKAEPVKTEPKPEPQTVFEPASQVVTQHVTNFIAMWNGRSEDDVYIAWQNTEDDNAYNVVGYDVVQNSIDFNDKMVKSHFVESMNSNNYEMQSLEDPCAEVILAAKAAGFSLSFSKTEEIVKTEPKAEPQPEPQADEQPEPHAEEQVEPQEQTEPAKTDPAFDELIKKAEEEAKRIVEEQKKAEEERKQEEIRKRFEEEQKKAEEEERRKVEEQAQAQPEPQEQTEPQVEPQEEEPQAAPQAEEQAQVEPKIEKNEAKHPLYDVIKTILDCGEAVYAWGVTGCGKTHMAVQLAAHYGLPLTSNGCIYQPYELIGYTDANGNYHETPFIRAVRYGYFHLFDEFDRSIPQAAVVCNSLLANGFIDLPNGERLTVHPNFHLFACGNTNGQGATEDYGAAQVLEISTLERFTPIEVGYDEAVELSLAGGDDELVTFIHEMRKSIEFCHFKQPITYRSIIRLCKFMEKFELHDAINLAIVRAMKKDDLRVVLSNLNCYNKYAESAKRIVRGSYNLAKAI